MNLQLTKVVISVVLFIFLFTAAGQADTGAGVTLKVIKYGVIKAVQTKRMDDPSTPTGTSVNAQDPKIVTVTDQLTAEIGATFGYEYLIVGLPFNKVVELREAYFYPEMKLPDGTLSTGYERIVKRRSDSFGMISGIQGYLLEKEYELVPGKWVLKLFYGEQQLAEQTFTISGKEK